MNKVFSIIVFLCASAGLIAQEQTVDWPLLAKVKWSERYFEKYDETVYYPDFDKSVLALNGKPIRIKGYVIPIDVESGYYVLSANPNASCFFCGNAGPESVMELQLVGTGNRFRTDDIVTFNGTLKLNWDDLEHCNYILQSAKPE